MEIDRAKREAARHKKSEAVDSFVATQKDEVVHSHQDGIKTVTRAGVVIRNDRSVGHEAMKRARGIIDSVESVTFKDNRAVTGTNDDWFEEHQSSVEQQISQKIGLARCPRLKKDTVLARVFNDLESQPAEQTQNPQVSRDEMPIVRSEFRPTESRLQEIASKGAELLTDGMWATEKESLFTDFKEGELTCTEDADFDNYRPVVDDDEPDYIPKSER